MVARLIEGWESSTDPADYAGRWTAFTGSPTIGTASGRFGNGLRLPTSTNQSATRTLDAQATWVVGFALRVSALPTGTCSVLGLLDGATLHCGLGLTSDTATLFGWRATTGTVLGTASAALTPGVWAYVEVKATISDTVGVFVVRVNGTTVLNLSAQDTRNAGNASANALRFGVTTPAAGVTMDFDDLYLFDGTGSVNNDFAGDCKVETLRPSGAGATTAWTPSAGSNYACVDEATPNGDTDYVASSTVNQTDTYATANLSTATGTVVTVQASASARKDDAGTRSLALVARPASTDRVGSTQALASGYQYYQQLWDTNPETAAAWTISETNASEFGVKLIV